MPHYTPLISTIVVVLVLAFAFGVVAQARELNPDLPIIARAYSEVEIDHLRKHGATKVVMGEHEIAKAMVADILPRRA
jgi:monovalent cation:H+ antiporter-2, CPA2 family